MQTTVLKVMTGMIDALKMRRSVAASRPATTVVSARLSMPDQWQRVSGTLTQAVGRAEQAHTLHSAATRQLDLAQYALITLMDELSAVMTVPSRRETAQVHRFEPVVQRPAQQALAA